MAGRHTDSIHISLLDLFSRPDLTELELPKTMKTDFPDPADVLNFTLTIEPDEGKRANSTIDRLVHIVLTQASVCSRELNRHVQARLVQVHFRHQQQLPT